MVLSPVALYYMLVGKGRFKHISHIYIISLISANVFLIWVPAGLTKRTSQDSASGSRCQFRRVGVESGNSVLTCLVQWKVAVHISNGIVTFQIFIHCFQWTMIMGERVLHSNLILFVDLSCSGDYTKIRPSVAVSLFFLVVCRTFLVVHIFFEQVHDWGYQKAIPLSVHNFTSMSCAPKGTTGFVSIIRTLPPRNKAFSGGVMNHHPYFLRFRWHWEEVIP